MCGACEVIRAAGILYLSSDHHVLLVRRKDGQGWAFPGGHIEEDESAEEAALREFHEEVGHGCDKVAFWTRRIQSAVGPIDPIADVNSGTGAGNIAAAESVDFTTFLARGKEFEPELNDEHDAWQWVDRDFAFAVTTNSGLIHPGCAVALRRFDMDELGIAKAIRDGELTSPQRYGNLLLVAIRITGTGIAYRPQLDEFPFRDKALYLTPEFLERCNGLPVILEHPPKDVLNSKEFKKRVVGTVFVPYVQGEEVWAIAKILDMEVAQMLETEQMSTSPAVICRGQEIEMAGETVLIEEKPKLVDHIALLVGPGVWDRGGPLAGVESIDVKADSLDPLDVVLSRFKVNEIYRRVSRF